MFFVITFLILILGRSNSTLLGFEVLNPDEAQFIANAIGIASRNFDITYFDGNSSGIINSFILTWPKLFNLDITFITTRLTATILLSLIILFSYKISKNYLNEKLSLFLSLPLVLFFALSKDQDFLHYSSELVSTFIIIFSYWMFITNKIENKVIFYLPSVLLSLIFFSKIQFGPVALIFFLIILFETYQKNKFDKKIIFQVVSFIIIPVFFLLTLYYNNTLEDFFINYYQYPKDYVTIMTPISENENLSLVNNQNIPSFKNYYFQHLLYNSAIHYYYLFISLFVFITIKNFNKIKIQILFDRNLIINLILTFSILACILIPGRNYRHYLISLMPIVPIFFSILLNIIFKQHYNFKNTLKNFYLILLFIFSVSLFLENKKFYSKKYNHVEFKKENINFKNPKMLNFLTMDNPEKLYIWGWMPKWYILSGYNPVSRSTITEKLIEENNYKDYYRNRLIKDINLNRPNLIIDFVRPKSFKNTQEKDNVENFMQLKNLIDKNYTMLKTYNKNCPSYYLDNSNFINFENKNINFIFKENKFIKMNDFSITEDVCDDKYNFSKADKNKFTIYFEKNEKIKEVLILSSKLNFTKKKIILKFLNKQKVTHEEKVNLKKYPYWSKVQFKEKLSSDSIVFEIEDLKSNNSGINEIKIFRK